MERRGPILICAALVALTVAVYAGALRCEFVHLDDDRYVTANPFVKAGPTAAGLRWAFTGIAAANWHPLTWLSHMLDAEIFGPDPRGHHGTSVALHAANTALLFLLLLRMTGAVWRSALVAALFAVHPLHVESVAWVSERKDVLSALFFLLALGAWLRHLRRPGPARYAAAAALYACGLMAKPMVVTFPFVLLLLDFWPLGRWRPGDPRARWVRCVVEKSPLLLLSAVSSVVTYLVQRGYGAVAPGALFPWRARLGNAVTAYVGYLDRMVRPVDLAVWYPHGVHSATAVKTAGAALLLAALSALAARLWRRRPYLAAGWLWYLGMLVPTIGIVQVGTQGMADRYTYLPLAGVFLAAAWALGDAAGGAAERRWALAAVAVGAVAALSWGARAQVRVWSSSIALLEHAVGVLARRNPGRPPAESRILFYNLGIAYSDRRMHREAVEAYRRGIAASPLGADLHYNLGISLHALGRFAEAVAAYREALRRAPDFAAAWFNLGNSLYSMGRFAEAVEVYREAVRRVPDFADAWFNLGNAYRMLGMAEEARQAAAESRRIERARR